jgi:hypothetical protein
MPHSTPPKPVHEARTSALLLAGTGRNTLLAINAVGLNIDNIME